MMPPPESWPKLDVLDGVLVPLGAALVAFGLAVAAVRTRLARVRRGARK